MEILSHPFFDNIDIEELKKKNIKPFSKPDPDDMQIVGITMKV